MEGEHLSKDHSVIILPTGEVVPNKPEKPMFEDC
jgi:hypothetical protein